MNDKINHAGRRKSRGEILKWFTQSDRFYVLMALIVESVLGVFIFRSTGFIQVLALCLFSVILIIGMIFVFLLSCDRKAKTSKSYTGIKRYWPSRDDALNEIKSRMLDSRNIFISGIALKSISPILGNPDVINLTMLNYQLGTDVNHTAVLRYFDQFGLDVFGCLLKGIILTLIRRRSTDNGELSFGNRQLSHPLIAHNKYPKSA